MNPDLQSIEKKWQKKWEDNKVFETKKGKKPKFYCLEMFPYPSGSGLHIGHAFNFTIGDVYSRFKKMQGYNVIYPMGYDSFGLPAENAAIKEEKHPKKYTEASINNFIKQQKALGLSYDWNRVLMTHSPEYYKWNQYFFLKFFEKGLAYKKKAPVNWCPKCKTVLANEQVHNGKCWRHEDTDVQNLYLEQWFVKTTDYADELLDMVDDLQWPERIKTMQKNWIGRSYGTEILFEIENDDNLGKWPVFTTRPDTLFGVTFMVISAQHPRLMELVTEEQKEKVEKFVKEVEKLEGETDEKRGAFTGSYAVNPLNDEKIPIYAGNFILADYGSGMVMGVPAHDDRDFSFAEEYNLPVKVVIEPKDFEIYERKGHLPRAYSGEGYLVNSEEFNGIWSEDAKKKITEKLKKKKLGEKKTQYKFKDWLISRQRYWGTPIPIVYCNDCGTVSVPEKELPVMLPERVKFGKGNPLETNKNFIETKCPKCGKKAKRETDTMDTFFDSSWYFLRYCDSKNDKEPFGKSKVDYWMPVNQYIGGAEHACMHLIYARFFTKALRDLDLLGKNKIDEPFEKLFNQGMIHGEDGYVMSKSRGNVVNPMDMINKYGTDSLRLSLVSFASPDKDTNWDENVLAGSLRFIKRIFEYFENINFENSRKDARTESKLNKIIKEITEDIDDFKYNSAVIKLRELFDSLPEKSDKSILGKFLKLLHPFCPHITEELWEKIHDGKKGFISLEKWPEADEKKINEKFEKEEQMIENLIDDINSVFKIMINRGEKITKCFVYVLPNEKESYNFYLDEIKKRTNVDVYLYAVNDKEKYDPEGKSKKAKPGKPAIYLE